MNEFQWDDFDWIAVLCTPPVSAPGQDLHHRSPFRFGQSRPRLQRLSLHQTAGWGHNTLSSQYLQYSQYLPAITTTFAISTSKIYNVHLSRSLLWASLTENRDRVGRKLWRPEASLLSTFSSAGWSKDLIFFSDSVQNSSILSTQIKGEINSRITNYLI